MNDYLYKSYILYYKTTTSPIFSGCPPPPDIYSDTTLRVAFRVAFRVAPPPPLYTQYIKIL